MPFYARLPVEVHQLFRSNVVNFAVVPLERCLASSVAKAMEDKCEAEGVATPGIDATE
jgi:hypothetical protein